MWIDLSKLVVLLFYFSTAIAYNSHDSKNDYIDKQRQYFLRSHHVTTTSKPSLFSYNHFSGLAGVNSNKVRHQSRFTKFDMLKTMIDSHTTSTTTSPPETARMRHSGWNRVYQTTTTDDDLFDNSDAFDEEFDDDYEDLEDDDNDMDSDDDQYLDDEDNTDDDDDELFQNWPIEEKSTTTTTKAPPPIHHQYRSSFTEYKWQNFGTQERVEQSRRQHMQMKSSNEQKGLSAFYEHFMRVKQQGQCKRPLLRVIPVQSEHPDPAKTYTPHCTVLHRCSEDTGCCKYNMKCQYKTRELVHLYFYTKVFGSSNTKVEKLSFYNHTECDCILNRNSTSGIAMEGNEISYKSGSFPENIRRCKCPHQFIPKLRYDDVCSCDCEDDNSDCIRMKKGKEHFGITDRKCISDSNCGMPICEYGNYMKQIGRCPKKMEKLDEFRRLQIT